MELKDKLKQLRKEKGLSQAQLAELLFVSRSTVAKWENGLGLPNPESMERLEQEFEISKEDIATSEPETVIVEKNRRLRRFGETAVILGVIVAVVVMCLLPFWIEEYGYGLTPEMSAGIWADRPYIGIDEYRFYYFRDTVVGENDQEIENHCMLVHLCPVKKHFWGYTVEDVPCYRVFDGNERVAILHSLKGKEGYYYNFIEATFDDDFQIKDYFFDVEQVYVNGFDSWLTDGFDLEGGELCGTQMGFFFISSEPVQWFHIGEVELYVDTDFVGNYD